MYMNEARAGLSSVRVQRAGICSFLVAIMLTLNSCGNNESTTQSSTVQKDSVITKAKDTVATLKGTDRLFDNFDTTMTLFADTAYKIALHVDGLQEKDEYEEGAKNATLVIYINKSGKKQVLSTDSLHCRIPDLMFTDYNGDKIKDLLIFHSSGARANSRYYLYLIKPADKKLILVKGFEEISNPTIDTADNIIQSINLSGQNNYSFYNIDVKNKLINLGHDFDEDPADTLQYEKAIKKIYKEKKGTVKLH